MTISSFLPPQRTLMGPGPSDIHPRVLQAMSRPTIGHLDPRFIEMMDQVLREGGAGSKTVFMPYEASGLMSSVGGLKELMSAVKD